MKIAIKTLGCKVNQYESESIKNQFIKDGDELVSEYDFADVYIINTCTVTGLADRKSRQYIRRMKRLNSDAVIAVTGCYAQVSPEEVKKIEGVDIMTGTNEKSAISKLVKEYISSDFSKKKGDKECNKKWEQKNDFIKIKAYEELTEYEDTGRVEAMESRTRAYVKIQEGCDKFCSYCIIPYARGAVRSRKFDDVLEECKELVEKGYKEIVLTGINTALYRDGAKDIEAVIEALQNAPGDFRIRLSSLEPTVVNADYVKKLLKYDKLCKHLHLSLQAGSDNVLKAMNRNYSMSEYHDIVDALKNFDENFGITTDIIVGFPGEKNEDFAKSVKAVDEIEFGRVHVFKYSKRQGTKAAVMDDQLSSEEKDKRSHILSEAADLSCRKFFEKNCGKSRKVLFEEYDEKTSMVIGYTDNYIKIYMSIEKENLMNYVNNFFEIMLREPFLDGVQGMIF